MAHILFGIITPFSFFVLQITGINVSTARLFSGNIIAASAIYG